MPNKTEKRRRIKKAKIDFVSLCPRGANRMPTLYKEDGSFEIEAMVKQEDEGTLLAVVYAPEFRDSQGDIASAEVIKDMAYSFMQNGGQIDIRHDGRAVGPDRAYVAENFIVQKSDPRFQDIVDYAGEPVDVTGGWATVIKLEDPSLRDLYSKHGWEGVSLAGRAEVVTEKEDTPMSMSPEDKAEIVKEVVGAVGPMIAEALAKLQPAPTPEPTPAPVEKAEPNVEFEGDPTNPKDLAKHAEKLRKEEIAKRVRSATSAAEVEKILKELQPAPQDDNLAKAGNAPTPSSNPAPQGKSLGSLMADYASRR